MSIEFNLNKVKYVPKKKKIFSFLKLQNVVGYKKNVLCRYINNFSMDCKIENESLLNETCTIFIASMLFVISYKKKY